MTKSNFIKMSGGVVIMFSVFLFLATSKQITKNGPAIKTFLLGENKIQTNFVQKQITPDNIIRGNFKSNTFEDNKSISSEKIKNEKKNSILKVETINSGEKGWQIIKEHTINYEKGTIYFALPEDESLYTGKYQLIFN